MPDLVVQALLPLWEYLWLPCQHVFSKRQTSGFAIHLHCLPVECKCVTLGLTHSITIIQYISCSTLIQNYSCVARDPRRYINVFPLVVSSSANDHLFASSSAEAVLVSTSMTLQMHDSEQYNTSEYIMSQVLSCTYAGHDSARQSV